MAIQAWGYAKSESSADEPTELSEVTLQASPEELRRVARFLMECAAELEAEPGFEHEHLHDPTGPAFEGADIIVAR